MSSCKKIEGSVQPTLKIIGEIKSTIGGNGGKDGISPTVEITPIAGGNRITITDVNGSKSADVMNGKDGAKGDHGSGGKPVTAYGAKGNGSTDDTAAFKKALAENRIVFVPGGTYKLTSGITIGDNCCLELAQDAVLNFTNTTGNCITLGMLSHLKGNHATIKVPYEFEGNVLYAYSNTHYSADINAVPPFSKWDPQWKSGRYVTDVNICKADSRGFHYAVEPTDCKGTAVYISADNTVGMLTFMWGVHYSGLRIAGAFAYGIRAENIDNGWLHEMRIDAFIDACEIGVSLESCSQVYVSATIQPRRAYSIDKVYAPYAKHGIKLVDSKNVDLSGSRIWDWENEDKPSTTENEKMTLWSDGGEYQRIAMYGNCTGTIINDFTYHPHGDTRKRIYTDNVANLETLTILQEPITKWFKVQNGEPYYNAGLYDAKLITQKDLAKHFDTGYVKNFTDVLATAIDTDGSVYNDIGYKKNMRIDIDGSMVESGYYVATGFIPCKAGSEIYAHDMSFAKGDDNCRVLFYDKDFNLLRYGGTNDSQYPMLVNRGLLIANGNTYLVADYTELEDGFKITLNGGQYNPHTTKGTAYARFVIYKAQWGEAPMVSIDEPIEYTIEGFLADGVKVKGENVIGDIGVGQPDWVAKKTESGGDNIVIPEQTVSSGIWNKRQMDIIPGMTYEVYINGTRYTCEAIAYGNSGAILGNNSSMSLNNYPFSVQWAGGSATSGMFFEDSTISSPVTLKVTDGKITEYDKMPVEYLPDGVAMKEDIPSGGGTSIDVTAEVGQTIIVKEVDANGKPTKWESAEYQPRTHWIEEAELLSGTYDAQTMQDGVPVDFTLTDGETYKVMWNGVEYSCPVRYFPADDGTLFPALGNVDLLLETGDTGEPFIMLIVMGVLADLAISEYTTVELSIKGNKANAIPQQYLGNAYPYYIEVTGNGTDDDPYVCNDTVSNVQGMLARGRQLVVRLCYTGTDGESIFYLPLAIYTKQDINGFTSVIYHFCGFNFYDINNMRIQLIVGGDNAFYVAKPTD